MTIRLRCSPVLLLPLLPVAALASAEKPVAAPLSAWTEIEAKAAAAPQTGYNMYRAAVAERALLKPYYAACAGWKAPAPLTPPPGYLANLPDKPLEPRFPLAGKDWPAKPGEASVCLWEDDKVAAVSFGIDDNNVPDIPAWREISKHYGSLNITWNIITGNIGGVINPRYGRVAGDWPFWQGMLKEGWRVESHSVTHVGDPVLEDGWPGPDWECAESRRQIAANLPGCQAKMFVPPGSAHPAFNISSNWRASMVKYYESARGFSGNPINPANQTDYFDIRTTAHPESSFTDDPRFAGFRLANILNDDPSNKYYRGWATFFVHGIGGQTDLAHSPNPNLASFGKVFAFFNANRGDLWVGFIGDVALYGEERDTAALKTLRAGPDGIALALTSRMDPAAFDYPLTVKVRLPDAWTRVAATQAGRPVPVERIVHEGAGYALVKALPNQGEILVAHAAAK